MLTAAHVLIASGAVTLWLASLWVKPFGRCYRCNGKRVVLKGGSKPNPGSKRKPKPAKPVRCRVCKGVGRRQRTGSRTVHRTARRIRSELDRQRKARQAAGATRAED